MSDRLDIPAGPLTVARATAADAADVVAVVRRSADWLAGRGSDQWDYYRTAEGDELIRGRIGTHEVYLARDGGGAAVGTLCLQWADTVYWPECGDDGSAGYVHQLAAVPGRGVGAAMLDWAAGKVRAAGRRLLRLDCRADNVGLCRYYAARGFARAGTVRPYTAAAQRWERGV